MSESTRCSETGRSFGSSEEARASELRFREIQEACASGLVPELCRGDVIYVDTERYLGHGRDDFLGGLAEVIEVITGTSAAKATPFVMVAKDRQSQYNWKLLAARQTRLREVFGKNWAHADPDERPEFNED